MSEPLHASAFVYSGTGCLVLGASGVGKSRLVAEAIAAGGKLVADDQVRLEPMMGMVAAAPVPQLSGILELRGLGIIRMNDILTKNVIHLVLELDPAADTRLPEPGKYKLLDAEVPYIRVSPKLSTAMLLLYMKAMQEGRVLPADWKPAA